MTYNKIEDVERAYFAGFFDGEGCVRIDKGNKSNGVISYSLRVSFGLTYLPILLKMQKYFGGAISLVDEEKRCSSKSVQARIVAGFSHPEKWKHEYYYSVNGRNALYFLKVVESFCNEKKQQANVAIKFQEGRRDMRGYKYRSDHETKRCEYFYQKLIQLKHEHSITTDNDLSFEDEQCNLFSFVEEE